MLLPCVMQISDFSRSLMKLSTQPPRGTRDWMPDEFLVRQYIFQTWRKVCHSFGYEEYLTPLVENADLYRVKSGEDVGGTELTLINDRGGRDIAIRPEMTPSVTRMVAGSYPQLQKPVKYFSIANFYRNEKPQRGRNREFWQLNVDVFGEESIYADVEILQISLEIMKALGSPEGSFKLYLNHRVLIDNFLEDVCTIEKPSKQTVVRLLDKWSKLYASDMKKALSDLGCDEEQIEKLFVCMEIENLASFVEAFPELSDSQGLQELQLIYEQLDSLGYEGLYEFSPALMRGFDYYDGMIFEMFDRHPDNNRSMFGGGRYNGLAGLWGKDDFAAVGFAPGDEPARLFLESRGLVNKAKVSMKKEIYFIPQLSEKLYNRVQQLAQSLRKSGKNVDVGFSVKKLSKALQYANKKNYDYVVILGEEELNNSHYKLKNMQTGQESIVEFA